MAQTSWPYENLDTTETQFSQWARNIGEGVKQNTGNQLEVTADGTGMTVSVDTGQALIRGHYYSNSDVVTLPITASDPTNPRIDVVVLELDPTANATVLKVLAGTPGAVPVAPSITQTDAGIYQILIANIQVDAASLAIDPGDVTDERSYLGKILGSNITGDITVATMDGNRLTNNIDTATISSANVTSLNVAAISDLTATATELNVLDGITATTAELNTLDGVTATAAEINVLDGITATTSELNILDGVTATAAELNYVDGVTSAIQTQFDGVQTELDTKAPLTPTVNAKTASYTLVAGDNGEFITCNGTFTITIPSATFTAGDRVDFVNIGTGIITFAGSGVTVNSVDALVTIDTQWAGATFFFTSSTAGVLIGKLA